MAKIVIPTGKGFEVVEQERETRPRKDWGELLLYGGEIENV